MRKTSEFTVDGTRYSTTHYSASKSVTLLARLVKIIGQPMGMLAGGGLDAQAKPDLIGSAISSLAANVEPSEFVNLCNEVLAGTIVFLADGTNRPIVFDTDFQGKIGHLFKVIKEVLVFQYDFLGGLAGTIPTSSAGQAKGLE